MAQRARPSTSYSTRASTSHSYVSNTYGDYITPTTSRPRARRSTGRPSTARPRTGASTIARIEAQQVICAVTESRGVSPTVGLAFANLDTGEAVLCQICDSQTYVKTVHKLTVYGPTEILIMNSAASPKSKLFSIIEENLDTIGANLVLRERRLWSESAGHDYIQSLAFTEDVEAIKLSVTGSYYALCCIAAVLRYVEIDLGKTFPLHSLRIKYEPSEGSMMIDVSTIYSLELVQNLHNPKSKASLFGLLNETLTPMGSRILRSNVLQPVTDPTTLNERYDALEELTTKEEMFFATRAALKDFLDGDKILTALIVIPTDYKFETTEHSINRVIMLKHFVGSVRPIYEALTGARSSMLNGIREFCAPENISAVEEQINEAINEDTTYARQPLELRNQRSYAVKSGVNGLLDVARTTYKEAIDDAYQHSVELSQEYDIRLDLKFDNSRQFYISIRAEELEERGGLPPVFTNIVRKKNILQCQTVELLKRNQRITLSHQEVVLLSDKAIQTLIEEIREHMSKLFKICEAIALLDMLTAFAQLVTSNDYVRPHFTDTLAIGAGRHPIREKIMQGNFVPNDVYASQQKRFQIITGCNMSGKSTYIRSIALMSIMAQIGCFVPATYASFPILHQLFARLGMDDSIETNVSTFAAEMKEIAFILRNVDKRSLVIVDELGRGTSTRDGLAIAIAIAEALVQSRALVWFATHFIDLARILAERNGVVLMHLSVEVTNDDTMAMLYKVASGVVKESHYGLALARVVSLPPGLLDRATYVAEKLERQVQQRKRTAITVIKERRRKLILNLKEHLVQAQNGIMEGEVLAAWLQELQKEFVNRMTAIDAEAAEAAQDGSSEDEDESMIDRSEHSEVDYDEPHERPVTQSTHDSQSSGITIDSRIMLTESESTIRAVSENDY